MRTIIAIYSIIIIFAERMPAQDSLDVNLLRVEYAIFKCQDVRQTNQLLMDQYVLLMKGGRYSHVMSVLDRMKVDTLLYPDLNNIKARVHFKMRDYRAAYNYMNDSRLRTKEDSILWSILLVENLRVKELLEFKKSTSLKGDLDSIHTYYDEYTRIMDLDCESYTVRSLRLPASGLFVQKAYTKGIVNLGLISGFLTYGTLSVWQGYYVTGVLTGASFAYQFYRSGARLSHNVCLAKQMRAKDEFKTRLYRLLL
ncbi:MAG TPA: hypothetical protein VL947_08105 [Cytophagales bacterium]|nr:hypothetical protein [Cytophagales bacterium]